MVALPSPAAGRSGPFCRSDVGQRSQVPASERSMSAGMGTTPHGPEAPTNDRWQVPRGQDVARGEEDGMDLRTAGSALLASASPTLTADLDAFRSARSQLSAASRAPRTVAVVGLIPGAGRTTAAALLAWCVAGYSDRRVIVVDAATPPAAPGPPSVGRPALTDAAARTITAMLGGDVT